MPLQPGVPFNLHSFRQTIGDPGRPYLFLVHIPHIGSDIVVTSMARTTTLPGYNVGQVLIPFQGVNIKLGTTPEFPDWTVTFLSDEAQELRRIIVNWQAIVYDIGVGETGHSNEYKSDQVSVAQLARTGDIVAAYNFAGCWPRTVAEITVGHDQNAAVEQFDVTFSYDFFTLNSEFGDATKADSMIRGTVFNINRGTPLPENGGYNPA